MAYIRVDHKQFSKAASEINEYIQRQKNIMNSIENDINELGSNWSGDDYVQAKSKWISINSKGSTTHNMFVSLSEYANLLSSIGNKYYEAQCRAISRANNLPRW